MGGIARLPFEVDSAASHNIISYKEFNRLQKELKARGMKPSRMLPSTVKIKLADGNVASQDCPVAQIKVSTDVNKFSNHNMALSFLVVKGPNCLIGRHNLARLWPSEFARFREKTCENYKIFGSTDVKSTTCSQINKVEQLSESEVITSSQVHNVHLVKPIAKSKVVKSKKNPNS